MIRLLRVVLVALYVLAGGAWIVAAVFLERRSGTPPHGLGRRAQRGWCRGLCRLLGIRLQRQGAAPAGPPVLLVANHVSWLDIVCVAAHWPVAFLSKSEVRRWPIIGLAASALGTLYIERGQRDAAGEAVAAMRRRLQSGGRVLFFPEGTTGDGRAVRAFRARLYQAAVDAGAPVQALGLQYLDAQGLVASDLAFTDKQSLVANVWHLAGHDGLTAALTLAPPRSPEGASRSDLARATQADVMHALGTEQDAAAPSATVRA